MSDTRFVLIGVALIFAGFVVLGAFGQQHYNLIIQAQEFGECFEYKDGTEVEADCSVAMQDRAAFFGLVLALVGAGVFFLIKGIRGKWDQNVKPEDAVGPGSSFPS
ncbi:hypothetical protein [Candidatus Nitrosotenuis cloacae]|jgi:hypothetical protein|uniref:hypothetical protein n=1 Tax=Candidatus Nitrosotenuis cloacae TaxID=1603555 RepID=UPI00227F98AF|nr:hypothetical protein [Candidatus Nitrosotenuis cloacae]